MRKFVEQFETAVSSSPIVLSSHVEKHFGPTGLSLYLRGNLRFINFTVLEIALFGNDSARGFIVDKYRFQYMTKDGQMIFRYDNAPHYPEMASFPHHKHMLDRVIPSPLPSLSDLLNEISAIMLREQS